MRPLRGKLQDRGPVTGRRREQFVVECEENYLVRFRDLVKRFCFCILIPFFCYSIAPYRETSVALLSSMNRLTNCSNGTYVIEVGGNEWWVQIGEGVGGGDSWPGAGFVRLARRMRATTAAETRALRHPVRHILHLTVRKTVQRKATEISRCLVLHRRRTSINGKVHDDKTEIPLNRR